MSILLILMSLTFAKPLPPDDYNTVRVACMKEMAQLTNSLVVCACHETNLRRRMTRPLMAVLGKKYRGESIEKDLATVEGANVIETFDKEVKEKCKVDPQFDVGPDE